MALTVGTVITGAAVVHLSASTPPRQAPADRLGRRIHAEPVRAPPLPPSRPAGIRGPRDGGISMPPARVVVSPGSVPAAAPGHRAHTLGTMLAAGASPVLLPSSGGERAAAIHEADHRRYAQQRFRGDAGGAQPRARLDSGDRASAQGPERAPVQAEVRWSTAGNRVRARAAPLAPPPATALRAVRPPAALRVAHLKVARPAGTIGLGVQRLGVCGLGVRGGFGRRVLRLRRLRRYGQRWLIERLQQLGILGQRNPARW